MLVVRWVGMGLVHGGGLRLSRVGGCVCGGGVGLVGAGGVDVWKGGEWVVVG